MDKLYTLLFELLRDYKSRKWVTTLGFAGLVVCNKVYGLGLGEKELYMILSLAVAYVVFEAIFDILKSLKN